MLLGNFSLLKICQISKPSGHTVCDLRTSIMTLGKIQIGRDNFLVSATVESEFIIVESYYGHFSSQLKL